MGKITPTPRQRRMMDRHDMDDIALLAALIIESSIWALFLGILDKAIQRPGGFTFHVTMTFLQDL
jgi:hypothetical protein